MYENVKIVITNLATGNKLICHRFEDIPYFDPDKHSVEIMVQPIVPVDYINIDIKVNYEN